MIELKVDISRVEYSDIFFFFIPNLLISLKEKGQVKHTAFRLAAKRPETAAKMVKSFINTLPEQKKEQFICKMVNSNEEAIVEALNKLCKNNDLPLDLASGEATCY